MFCLVIDTEEAHICCLSQPNFYSYLLLLLLYCEQRLNQDYLYECACTCSWTLGSAWCKLGLKWWLLCSCHEATKLTYYLLWFKAFLWQNLIRLFKSPQTYQIHCSLQLICAKTPTCWKLHLHSIWISSTSDKYPTGLVELAYVFLIIQDYVYMEAIHAKNNQYLTVYGTVGLNCMKWT